MSKPSKPGRFCACGREIKFNRKEHCETCHKRRWRENNPVQAVYSDLRSNARRRGVGFFITFGEFVDFIVDTAYMRFKGRFPKDLTIDRKIPKLGYRAGNLQILPNEDNVRKYRNGEAWEPVKQTKEDAGTPF